MVLKARDADLGRDLALKVLLDRHRGDQDVIRRFVEEAQIGGQLQHPGIVPVHELGTLADLRPFFTMKLVKGRTLAALLAERNLFDRAKHPHANAGVVTRGNAVVGVVPPRPFRGEGARRAGEGAGVTRQEQEALKRHENLPQADFSSPHPNPPPPRGEGIRNSSPLVGEDTRGGAGTASDLPRFLSIFEAVCQTMAYAHARRVIHRDLKPANVMVGNFGEVQVMDWGLAKVLAEGGIADEARAMGKAETAILTVRSGSAGSGSESQAGSVLGTPAYMAPEQARGDVEQIDERADVFGLGAILCEILTGRPPYVGSTREEIRDKAARGELTDALLRLEASGVDGDLTGLARDCLAAARHRRPRNAGAVVQRVTSYLAGVQERLKTAELARVEAQARAEEETKRRAVADELAREARARADEERKRRRTTAALAASVLAFMTLGGLSVTYVLQQRQARAARVERLLARAGFLRDEARARPEDTVAWEKARDALDQVEAAPDTRARLDGLMAEVQTGLAGAERLATLRQALVNIRANQQDAGDEVTDLAYAEAFRAAGVDLDALAQADAAAQIRRHSAAIVIELATALDHWSEVRHRGRRPAESWLRPLKVSRLADPDPYRDRLRGLIAAADLKAHAGELRTLASAPDAADLPAATALVLAAALARAGATDATIVALRRAVAWYPEDVWLNWSLAGILAHARPPRREEALGYYRAARSLRPETAHALAHHLEGMGKSEEAETVFRDLIHKRPDDASHLVCYGIHLQERGRANEAWPLLERAVTAGREAICARPTTFAPAYTWGSPCVPTEG